MKIYDISLPIKSHMLVWPGDPPVTMGSLSAIAKGDHSNVTQIQMSVHTGTHIDAPRHFIDSGGTIDQIPLRKMIGKAFVMIIDDDVDVISDQVLESHSDGHLLNQTKKVLFRTRNSSLWRSHPNTFQTNYVGINALGAALLASLNLDLIGVDYLSVAPYDETSQPHQILLSEEIVLLEGIDLSGVPSGFYDLYCLPLMIRGCEGAPARVILIDRS